MGFSAEDGEGTGIIGKNGSGKSTLLKVLAGLKPPVEGDVLYNGLAIPAFSPIELAEHRAFLQQRNNLNLAMTVEDIVALGNIRGTSLPKKELFQDFEISQFRHRSFYTLSGGEQQKVLMAMVSYQLELSTVNQKFLFLDEPLNNLDAINQKELMIRIRKMTSQGIGIIIVLHDLDKALQLCDRIAVLSHGKIVEQGDPKVVLTEEFVHDQFGIKTQRLIEENGVHRLIEVSSALSQGREENSPMSCSKLDHN
ncbi:MAG: ABC transporter ATP-binding protein [Flavobacteriales bacterium]|nr:ABC transporter ATP-binding protein [Flavobacteriales bacterium]